MTDARPLNLVTVQTGFFWQLTDGVTESYRCGLGHEHPGTCPGGHPMPVPLTL